MVLPLGDVERTRTLPVVTYGLIVANVLMFVFQIGRGEQFTTAYAATPFEITQGIDIPAPFVLPAEDGRDQLVRLGGRLDETVIPQGPVPFPIWCTLITSLFLHGSVMHLVGNMLYLWIFGDNVEEVLGRVQFLLMYLGCGLFGSVAQILANPYSLIPTLGASGAIAGVMGAYLVWFPHHRIRVLVLFTVLEVPAIWMIGFWIITQAWHGLGTVDRVTDSAGVAYLAHVGGAAAGVVVGLIYRDRAHALGHATWWGRRY